MDVLESNIVTIRKSCHCWGCAREFKSGSRLTKVTTVDGGHFWHGAWCDICLEYLNDRMDNGEDIRFGEIKQNDPDVWEEIKNQIEGG